MAERLTIEGVFKDLISAQVDRVQGRLKTLGFTGDSVFKGLLKFASAEKVFQGLAAVAGTVWKEALAESPKLSKQFDQIKEKIGILVATMAREVIPVFTAVFKFLLENWNQIRFGFSVGIAVIKDAFNGLLGAFQMLASGFFNGLALVSAALEKFGLVSQETVDGFTQTSEAFAEKAVDSFGKVGKTVDVLKAGVAGLGAEVKATYDIFGDKKKLEDAQKALEANNEAASDKAEAIGKKSRQIMRGQLDEETAMIAEEQSIRKELLLKISEEKISSLEVQSGKELEVLDLKHAKEIEAFKAQKGLSLLTEEEKQIGLTEIENRYAKQREEIQTQTTQKQIDNVQAFTAGFSDLFTTQFRNRKNQIENELASGKKLREEAVKAGRLSKEEAEKQNKIEEEKAEKAIASQRSLVRASKVLGITEAIINTSVGITKAFRDGGILGFLAAGGIAAAGAAQIATINAQKFANGGFPQGRNSLVMVNDGGGADYQESILNGRATKNLGRSAINALNAGQSIGGDTFVMGGSTSIIINGNANAAEVKQAVNEAYADKLREFAKMQKAVKDQKIKV